MRSGPRQVGLLLFCGMLGLLACGPRLLVELGRAQNRWEGRPAEAVVCSFRARTGQPCLGCGGTRALELVAHGELRAALATNVLGTWVGLALWAGALLSALTLVRGHRPPWKAALVALVASGALAFLVAFLGWWRRLP